MNNEPENRIQDARVTETYQALANERTPDHLTSKVLKLAADVRTPYARARAWMRPAAWAATVGLSLAIVLELTQLPSSDLDYVSIAPAADSDAPGQRAARNDDSPARSVSAETPAALSTKKTETGDEATRKRATGPASVSQETASKEDFAPRAEQVMQEAEALVMARAGSDTGSVGAAAEARAPAVETRLSEQMSTDLAAAHRDAADRLAAKQVSRDARSAAAAFAEVSAAAESGQACPESERETADAWFACIRQLRESERDELADEEYEEFRQVYPEFDDSVTYK